ncbi:MAG: cell division protein SepF [Firmicutes bacterium]|nr:cell division protein SepF [Bacillota bacterium]
MGRWGNEQEEPVKNSSNHSLFDKFLNMFGFEAEIVEEEAPDPDVTYHRERDAKERGKLVSLTNNANKNVKMVIIEPSGFDEVQAIVDHLKNKRAVIINLEELDKTIARRIADFLGGAIYALEGSMQRISGSIFLFTPAHIEVTMPLKTELKDKERAFNGGPYSSNTLNSLKNERDRL